MQRYNTYYENQLQRMKLIKWLLLVVSILAILSCEKNEETSHKKIFRYNQAEGISSLDPAFARNQANIWAVNQLFNGLVEHDEKLQVISSIAESWTISGDGKIYTFKLKKGVNFHDSDIFPDGIGREVKARDFVYSFKRIMNHATASTGAWVFNDKVLKEKDGSVSDTCFMAVNDYTFRIYLREAFPPFIHMLTMPYCYVIPHEGIQKYDKDFRIHPVGTGPFKLKIWEEGSTLIFLKNDKYWRKDEKGTQLPYLDAIQVSFMTDKNIAFLTFLKGKLDFISGIDETSKEQILDNRGNVKTEFSKKFKVQKLLYLNTEYLGFQIDPEKLKDKNHPFLKKEVRKAMSYAIDRAELVAYLRNNLGIPGLQGMIPYPMPSFNKDVKGYNYNLEKALSLLKEAGYPGGHGLPEFDLYTTSDYKEISEYLQKQWSKLGIKVNIQVNQASTFRELVDNGRVSLFRGSWIGDYPDAENYLSLFYSKNFSPGGPNKTHFVNKEFDRLYELAQKESHTDTRYSLYRKMDQIVMDECPVIVLYYDELVNLTQNRIKGIDVNPMNMLKLERVDYKDEKVGKE